MSVNPVEIRLTLEGMRYTIIQAIFEHQRNIEKIIEQEVDEALKGFDFAGEIKSHINSVLGQTIKESINKTIKDVFVYDEEVQKMLKEYVVENIKLTIKEK